MTIANLAAFVAVEADFDARSMPRLASRSPRRRKASSIPARVEQRRGVGHAASIS
jgi:hypothetical protein